MRVKLLLLTGAACLMPVGLGADEREAETSDDAAKAPVIYATEQGAADPETDTGAFDYGAGDGIDAVAIAAATGGPTPLKAEFANGPAAAGGLYGQDPIYRMAQASEAEPTMVEVAAAATTQPIGYVEVQPGDTVFALSRRYGVSPAQIIDANEMSAPYGLTIGQQVLIPGLADTRMADNRIAETAETTAPKAEEPVRVAETPRRAADSVAAHSVAYSSPAAAGINQPAEDGRSQTTAKVEAGAEPGAETRSANPLATDISYADQTMGATYHTVEQGNTLYSIAKSYGLEVKAVAEANALEAPYNLSIGQSLLIPLSASQSAADISARPQQAVALARNEAESAEEAVSPVYETEAEQAAPTQEANYGLPKSSEKSRFDWPLQGRVVMSYGMSEDGRRNDGINIAAPVGTPIRSVDDGEVVYRGAELEGYGNLLLIKHTDGWVSAYAHTDAILVDKGDTIRKGQIIAKVGATGSVDQPQLHFELRHELKPTDPVAALDGSDLKAVKY